LLTEVFSGISVVQAFAAQDYEVERFSQEARHNRNARYKTEKLKATQYPIVGFLEAVSIMFLFFIGGWQISQGNLKSEDFVSYLAAVAILLQPIDLITSNYNEFKQAEASVDRIFELIDVQPAIEQKKDSLNLPIVLGKVELSEVSFYYKQDKQVLKNVNLLVKPGQVIALVGASGAGKTTLVKLISRFYDPQKGKISIDDIVSLRRQIGIVPQENILFSGTIAQNIAYGQDQLDFKAIEKASQIANAHSFIMQFPQGYHTWVGERGVNLSGGQKQRIAIARAVMLNPRIMILDEATSALDSSSEALVQEALERVMENRTVFVVAHRLSTIRNADCIVVLEDGQIVESGNHDQLLVKKGHYAKFYEQQYAKRLDQF
jgi:ATP-binding cassette subfamily B protein